MEKGVLECLLKKHWKERSLDKVISVESSPAVGKFLNFLSTVTRLKMKIVLGNGRVATKSLIMKIVNSPTEELFKEFNEKYCAFQIETMMYQGVLKEMKYLMEEFEDTDDVLWCNLIHHIPYTCLVLEDLKPLGFSMLDRPEFLDLEHSLLAVNALGRFHAMCKVLEEKGVVSRNCYKPWYIFDNFTMHQYLHWDMASLRRAIRILWDPAWGPIVDKINITLESLHNRFKNLGELDETKFNVLNHGDCHKNNLVFKHDSENRPVAIRFLDFQLVHYGSPCIDLTFLLYLSARPSVRRENFNLLLQTYHDSLVGKMDQLQFRGYRPTIEEIRDAMEKYSLIGLWVFIAWYPSLSQSDRMGELLDYEKIKATGGMEGHKLELYEYEFMESVIGADLKKLVQKLS